MGYEDTELEPFKVAAELGCKDFRYWPKTGVVEFIGHDGKAYPLPQLDASYRLNRYAGAVCESFFLALFMKYPEDADDDLAVHCLVMAEKAKEYREKRGGPFEHYHPNDPIHKG